MVDKSVSIAIYLACFPYLHDLQQWSVGQNGYNVQGMVCWTITRMRINITIQTTANFSLIDYFCIILQFTSIVQFDNIAQPLINNAHSEC